MTHNTTLLAVGSFIKSEMKKRSVEAFLSIKDIPKGFTIQFLKNKIMTGTLRNNTNLHSRGDRDGSEEPHPQAGTRACLGVRRGER
jgi:hypothetical protein